MNGLAGVAHVLETGATRSTWTRRWVERARVPIDRMLAFTAALKSGQPIGAIVPHLGAA